MHTSCLHLNKNYVTLIFVLFFPNHKNITAEPYDTQSAFQLFQWITHTFRAFLNSSSDSTICCCLSKRRNKSSNTTLFSLQYLTNFAIGGRRGLGGLNPPIPPWGIEMWELVSFISFTVFSMSSVIVMPSSPRNWKVEVEQALTASSKAARPGGWIGLLPICRSVLFNIC